MTTILIYTNGRITRRCDANCHDAASPASRCNCICGGVNHGIGRADNLLLSEEEIVEIAGKLAVEEHTVTEWGLPLFGLTQFGPATIRARPDIVPITA